MIKHADLLIEIGTEELPPKALQSLANAFAQQVTRGLTEQGLSENGLNPQIAQVYATPRRLAMIVGKVKLGQEDKQIEKQGPSVQAPDKAKEGFARSCGVDVAALDIIDTNKGQKLSYSAKQKGKQAFELIPGIVEKALHALPIPKRMRWGDSDAEFVRPVHWIVMLHGKDVIKAKILGIKTGNQTRGHRFHHPQALEVTTGNYVENLETVGKVIVDFSKRKELIREQVKICAATLGGEAIIEPGLLDEVTALVEWPVALAGNFETEFLDVPNEALIYAMQDHQKYFPVKSKAGKLLPHFITVSNIESKKPQVVIDGNERVIRPRLADASFFWEQDRKQTLDSRVDLLQKIVFQKQLGTLYDKTMRVKQLAAIIATVIGADVTHATRAAELGKCDLLTDMVGEFASMQGIAGRYYATHDGEATAVAAALEQQYLPKFAGDDLPENGVSQALALADKIDTMVGIFGIGQAPTGSKDPFALRRASLSVLRIMIEKELDLDLLDVLKSSEKLFADKLTEKHTAGTVFEYSLDRLKAYYQDQGFKPEVIDAVTTLKPSRPLDFDKRVRAVAVFSNLPEAESLAAANKRISNILRDAQSDNINDLPTDVNVALFENDAETQLFEQLQLQQKAVSVLFTAGNYEKALKSLASLRKPIDRFFDDVMVMAEDVVLKQNRLALLSQLRSLFLHVADLSMLHTKS